MIIRALLLLCYALAFQFAYQYFLSPTYEYAFYRNVEMSLLHHLLTLAMVVAPSIFYKDRTTPSGMGVMLIYIIVYVPAQIMIPRMLDDVYFPTVTLQMTIAGSMAVLCVASNIGYVKTTEQEDFGLGVTAFIAVLAIPSLLALVLTNYQHMRLVDFANIYDLREDSSKASQIPIINYTSLWLSYCFLPYFITRGVVYKDYLWLAFGIFGCLLIYLATGSKAQILLPVIIFGFYILLKYVNLTMSKLAAIFAFFALFIAILPEEGIYFIIKQVYLQRTLSTGGLTISLYYEFFTAYGYTYYTHINIFGPLIGNYPYGSYSMGQVIGLEYYGSEVANYNANFWASDGVGAMGIAGIPIITTVLAGIFIAINRLSSYFDSRFVSLWMLSFLMALLNLPLSTAMLSGGGLMILLILVIARLQGVTARSRSGLGSPPLQNGKPQLERNA